MASFYIPLTGLNSDSTALNTIANNLSNMNTVGYKSQSVNFSDLFHQQVGSTDAGDPIQVGSGTQVASIATNFTPGSPNTTGVPTDVALQGNGFFVVSDGSAQLLTRAGNFETDSSGNLITAGGLNVMGYPAANGVVDTKARLTAINIPKSQVEPPKASTTFGMTAILDSSAAVGTSVPGTVQVFDSLGKQYNATVTYTKTGTNAWSYSVTLPDTLNAAPATVPAATTIPVTAVAALSQDLATSTVNYDFGSAATVNPGTNLTITGPAVGGGTATITPPAIVAGESVTKYAADLTLALRAAGIQTGLGGVTVSATNGQLSIVGPATTMSIAGTTSQDLTATTVNYSFALSAGKMATVDPSTNLTITGQTVGTGTATTIAPKIVPGETVAQYAQAMNAAIGTAGISGVAVTSNAAGLLSIVGANISTSGGVIQEPVPSASAAGSLNFDANGNLVGPTADVSGISFIGLSQRPLTTAKTSM
jgi:flagellar hook protein FlgE